MKTRASLTRWSKQQIAKVEKAIYAAPAKSNKEAVQRGKLAVYLFVSDAFHVITQEALITWKEGIERKVNSNDYQECMDDGRVLAINEVEEYLSRK